MKRVAHVDDPRALSADEHRRIRRRLHLAELLDLGERALVVEKRADGAVLLKCGTPLAGYPKQIGDDLRAAAAR